MAETREATLRSEVGDARVLASESRLRSVFENLFRNAAEHGGPTVTVEVGLLEGRPGFYISDDGDGIPDSAIDRIFEPGYSTSDSGTGFGLSIVADIVEAHEWSIRVTESEQGGSRFEVSGVDIR